MELLLTADPSIELINSYLKPGSCHIAQLNSEIVGVLVLNTINPETLEIKNIAVHESQQGKGIGNALLAYSEKISRESGYKKLVIGTGNSSFRQLNIYQKAGFEIDRIKKNYFTDNYEEPIFENGIQCKHLIILEKEL
ncbi:GNAT family N-acetyltransferase [Flammeovirgaceae bacterium KN852]|uniref:GNAT family N-acetyltransferase n=2 Tax=Marinigracilibium pacificum TaxID=2729599 RepID=A0A848J089_9BACT|nr:GNAT family N-acetyltransferase [Marinigracilibium pacificum]